MLSNCNRILDKQICVRLWNNLLPSQISCFGWRLLLNGLLTMDALLGRGIQLENNAMLCLLCLEEIECVDHIFVKCAKIQKLWKRCYGWWGLNSIAPVLPISYVKVIVLVFISISNQRYGPLYFLWLPGQYGP
ncbi:hypothetical protein SLA2020_399930 [Shorea laevis]